MAVVPRRQRGVNYSPSSATPGGEGLEHSSPRWESCVTHMAPNTVSEWGTRKKSGGGYMIFSVMDFGG